MRDRAGQPTGNQPGREDGGCPVSTGTTRPTRRQLLAMAEQQGGGGAADTPGKKPNIVFIMGDDVGWFNIGAYHRGIMSGKTPNLDKLASQGMLFTDYYAEASCTAGRASFITGEIPLRTGLTTVVSSFVPDGAPLVS